MRKIWILAVFISVNTFAQKNQKGAMELASTFLKALSGTQSLKPLQIPVAVCQQELAEMFQGNTPEQINLYLLEEEEDWNFQRKELQESFNVFGLQVEKIQLKSVKLLNNPLIDPRYYAIDVVCTYQSIADTFQLGAMQAKNKKWYLWGWPELTFHKFLKVYSTVPAEFFYKKGLERQGQPLEAFKYFSNALFLDSTYKEAWYQRGMAMVAMDSTRTKYKTYWEHAGDVMKNFEQALSLDDEYIEARLALARYAKSMADYITAKDQYEYLIKLDSVPPEVHFELAEIFKEEANYAEAIYYYTKALEANPKNIHFLQSRGELYYRMGQFDKSRDDFQKIISLKPDELYAYYRLGWLENETKNHKKALIYLDKSLELDPKHLSSLNERAFAHKSLKNFKSALQDYMSIQEISPTTITKKMYVHRGDCYAGLKMENEACQEYRKALFSGSNEKHIQSYIEKKCP